MEETEYDFLRSRGLSVVLHDDRGTMGFPRLSVQIEILRPAVFEQSVTVQLELCRVDGKQIAYDFTIGDTEHSDQIIATGNFTAACCRFPSDAPPYAMLTPEFVVEALLGPAK